MYVIVTGDAFDGLNLWGPFETIEEAHDWAEMVRDDWTCVKVNEAV